MQTPIRSSDRRARSRGWRSSASLFATVALVTALTQVIAPSLATAAIPLQSELPSNGVLASGQFLTTANGQMVLTMQESGDLVLQGQGDLIWHSGTAGFLRAYATMQGDGNLVVRSSTPPHRALWNSTTAGNWGAHLTLQDDGNLYLYNGGSAIWNLGKTDATLGAGHTLLPGWALTSSNHLYRTVMQSDGNLVTYSATKAVWNTKTAGKRGGHVIQQNDGNLVIYQVGPVWNSRTFRHPGSHTTLTTTGALAITAPTGYSLWASDQVPVNTTGGCGSVLPDQSGTPITRWNPVTQCVLTMLHQSASSIPDVNLMIQWESGGDPNAINNYDINAQQGHPSEGLIQVIQPTFNTWHSPLLANRLLDPAANLFAGLNYAIHTYGSIHNVPGLVSLRNGGGYKGYVSPKN